MSTVEERTCIVQVPDTDWPAGWQEAEHLLAMTVLGAGYDLISSIQWEGPRSHDKQWVWMGAAKAYKRIRREDIWHNPDPLICYFPEDLPGDTNGSTS